MDKTTRRTELEIVYQGMKLYQHTNRPDMAFIFSDGVPVQYCQQPTNGVTYFRALNSCHELPENLMSYVPLFCTVIPRWGGDYHQESSLLNMRKQYEILISLECAADWLMCTCNWFCFIIFGCGVIYLCTCKSQKNPAFDGIEQHKISQQPYMLRQNRLYHSV